MATKNPVVEVAQERKNGAAEPGIVTLSTGVKVRMKTAPSGLVEEAVSRIEDPPVPMQEVEGKKYPVPNPNHPDYVAALQRTELKRVRVALDALVMFALDLVDGLPEDETWLKKLRFMEKRGHLDLSEFDLDDPIEKEFVFKRFFAVADEDWELLNSLRGVTQEDLDKAGRIFRSQTQ